MECPACHVKIGVFKNVHFTAAFFLKRVQPCPYCKTSLYRPHYPTWAYFKDILFVIFLIGVIFFLLAIIFGTVVGYQTALVICFWFWVIAVAVIGAIILTNILSILLYKYYRGIRMHIKKGRQYDNNLKKSNDNRGQ